MNYYIFGAIILALCLISLWIGKSSSKTTNTTLDYFLSGRRLKFFSLTLTLLATQLGGGAIIGNGDAAYFHGIKALLYSFGLSLGLLALASGIGERFRNLNISTIPELFQVKYNSPTMQTLAAVFSIVSLFLILMAIGIAGRKIFIAIGLENPWIFMAFWSVAIIYTVMGGLSAVVKTDVLQILFIAIVLFITLGFVVYDNNAEWAAFSLSQTSSTEVPWSEWLLMPLLFVIIGQDMGQRCFAAESPKTVTQATFWAAIFLTILSAIPTFFGILAASLLYIPSNSGSIILNFIQDTTNPYITSLFAASILMAILSTADSLICSIGFNISHDILGRFIKSQSVDIKISRYVTFLAGFIATALSCFFDDIISVMVFAYKISIYALFVPILMAAFFEKPSKEAAATAITTGILAYLISLSYPYLAVELFSLLTIFIAFLVVQYFMDQRKK